MPEARGLTDTKYPDRKCIRCGVSSRITRKILISEYALEADDNGSIGAYMIDSGLYRCEAFRWMARMDRKEFKTIREVRTWWNKWKKKIA